MKKLLLILALFVSILCLSLVSCKKDKSDVDVLEGTWKTLYDARSTGDAEYEMTYIFDGKGKFTYKTVDLTGFVWNTAKGTYTIEENNTVVRLHGVSTNERGISREYDYELTLDLNSKPATLTIEIFNSNGDYWGEIVFEKQ